MNIAKSCGIATNATVFRQLPCGLYIPASAYQNPKSEADRGFDPGIIAEYKEYLRLSGRAESTIEKYIRDIRTFAGWLGELNSTSIRVREWAEQQLQVRRASTVNCALAALNGFFKWLGRQDCVVGFFKVQETPYLDDSRCLTESEFNRMKERADQRMRAILLTFRATGIRVSELKFFTVEAVRAGRITVRNKGKIRDVFIDEATQQMLLEYCDKAGIESGIVFRGRDGGPISRNAIWRNMKVLAKKVGIAVSKVFPHNLRHLFAVERYRAEPDIEALRLDMGHSVITTTQRYLKSTLSDHWERVKGRDRVKTAKKRYKKAGDSAGHLYNRM